MSTQPQLDQDNNAIQCGHPETNLTVFTASNATTHYRVQCRRCGATLSNPRKVDLTAEAMRNAPPFDEALVGAWARGESERRQRERDEQRDERRAWYGEYLRSDAWRERRRLVMQRARNLCEGCRQQKATEVHHLHYHRVGREMLFDLVALCGRCHDAVHGEIPADVDPPPDWPPRVWRSAEPEDFTQ